MSVAARDTSAMIEQMSAFDEAITRDFYHLFGVLVRRCNPSGALARFPVSLPHEKAPSTRPGA